MGKSDESAPKIRIYNCSKQLVPLQMRPPGAEFFTNEQQVRIRPGQDVMLRKDYLNQEQIANLRARKIIQVTYDSELISDNAK